MINGPTETEIKRNNAIDRMFDDFFKEHQDDSYPTPKSLVSYIEAAGGSVGVDRKTYPKIWWKKACEHAANSGGQLFMSEYDLEQTFSKYGIDFSHHDKDKLWGDCLFEYMNRKELFPELVPERLSGFESNVDVFVNKDQYQGVRLGLIVDKENRRFALGTGDAFPLVSGKKISKKQIVQLATMLKDMGAREVEIESEYARTSLTRVTGQDKKKKTSANHKKNLDDDVDSPSI
ncbi:hypothetical protein [uncultured Treponema sp.]|uniref:hypothetical protein n=1 Tax=uncultured Treponema sp. TaxID=162155 RepID=UPI00259799EA|nr:hypothetical protein [uncultured Treponema sp.]